MVRKSGKSFRLGEKFRLTSNTSTASREKGVLGARLSRVPCPTKNGPGENPGPLL